jgi:hypothetical protein
MRRWTTGAVLGCAGALVALLPLLGCSDLGVSRSGKKKNKAAATGSAVAAPSPKIVISSPQRGEFMAPGRITVTGEVFATNPAAPVTEVELQGQIVPVAGDGTFSGQVDITQGPNVIQVTCTDAEGNGGSTNVGVLAGDFKPITESIPNAAAVRLNDSALGAFGKIVERIIWSVDITSKLQGAGPLYEKNILWIEIWASVVQVRFQDVFVTIDSDSQGLYLRAEIPQLTVDVDVEAKLGLGSHVGPAPATIQADRVVLEGRLRLDPNPDGTVRSDIINPTLDLVNFQATSSSQLIQVALPLVKNAVEKGIRDGVAELLNDDAKPAIDRELVKFLQPQGWDVFGKPYAYDLRLERAVYDDNGMSLQCSFNSQPVNPTGIANGAPGSLVTPGQAPALQTFRGAMVVFDDDIFNRAFYGAWAGGVLDFEVDAAWLQSIGADPNLLPLNIGAITQFVPEVAAVADDNAPLRLRVEPMLPPVIEMTGVPDLIQLSACEVAIYIDVDRGSGWEELLHSVIHVGMGASLELDSQGFAIRMASLPDIRVDIVNEPLVELDDRKLQVMLGLVLTPAIPQLLNGINVLPIPHVDQLTAFNVYTGVGGNNSDFLVGEANLQR